ncbi:hypothetical protein ARAM_002313, partial [Aspergillus rambellii]
SSFTGQRLGIMKRNSFPIEALAPWARLNGVSTHEVAFRKLQAEDGTDKGGAIVATGDILPSESGNEVSLEAQVLLKVPSDMILSYEMVENHAKSDRYLRDVLDVLGDFGKTARGAILTFLLIQVTHSCPEFSDERHKIGVSNPWTEYVNFLPSEIPLPTFWTMEELELLRGTSLRLAYEAKILSLETEFDHLRQSTAEILWCQEHWWDEDTGKLTFDDWKYLDAAFRSRSVDLPGRGHSMVPCIDMANHASESMVNALYEKDIHDNAILQLRPGKGLHSGDEVTISYGADKAASEMVFSYGFLDQERTDAKQLFLDLDIPEDDPLKRAKKAFCNEAPGVRIISNFVGSGETKATWESPIIWWACVNEEDGLEFTLLQTNDGGNEVKVTWKEEELTSPNHLKDFLTADPSWDIFQLRAVVLILERLETQFFVLQTTERMVSDIREDEDMRAIFRPDVFNAVTKLRELEGRLLEMAIKDLENQRQELMMSEAVRTYLTQQQSTDIEEDFS